LIEAEAFLAKAGVDLLFCPFTAPTYRIAGVPTVCILYDLQYKVYPQFFSPEDVAQRDRTFQDACRYATRIAAISNYSRESAIAHGMDSDQVRKIYIQMAGRVSVSGPNDGTQLARLGLTSKRYFLYPANFWKHKNHEMLLTAFGMACKSGMPADIRLVCTGAPGDRKEWLVRAAERMRLEARVLFPGYIPSNELSALVVNACGLLFPSLYEGFGLPVIEAMAAGVPVACSSTTSLPEVAGIAAAYFDPRIPQQIADAMRHLLDDEYARSLVESGRQQAAKFSDSGTMAQEYWGLLVEAHESHKHRSQVTGVYADAWVGTLMKIFVSEGTSKRTVRLVFHCPDWAPIELVTIQQVTPTTKGSNRILCARGAEVEWKFDVDGLGGHFEFVFSPTFVPASVGMGNDMRGLSVLVRNCEVVSDGQVMDLLIGK
jgi:glycosyltransferase involved in cell wall biosynthesis